MWKFCVFISCISRCTRSIHFQIPYIKAPIINPGRKGNIHGLPLEIQKDISNIVRMIIEDLLYSLTDTAEELYQMNKYSTKFQKFYQISEQKMSSRKWTPSRDPRKFFKKCKRLILRYFMCFFKL